MGLTRPGILFGKVMHKRTFPRVNQFVYGIYYLTLPLDEIAALPSNWQFAINRFALMSFYDRDHGPRDGSSLLQWIRTILQQQGLSHLDGKITLVCMPRLFGYVFNPVSFWLCHDRSGELKAVLCEVNNTFGETHSYLCRADNDQTIDGNLWLEAKKLFHVSPFLKREGTYRFRFDVREDKLGIWIDFYDAEQKRQLLTSLVGDIVDLQPQAIRRALCRYPLVTLKAITLIHWQAIKLLFKRQKYVPKPEQITPRLSTGEPIRENITKI